MKLRHFSTFAILLFTAFTIGCSKGDSEAGAITLAINSKPGDKQIINTDIDQHITTKVMEQDLKIDQTIEMDMTMTTKEAKDSGKSFVMEGMFDRWAMKMDMQGAGMSNQAEFDTKDSTKNKGDMAPMMSQLFSRMIGQAFMMEMGRDGKVISTNMKEVMAKIMPQGSTNSMSDDAMGTVPFPDHPVKPGDKWTGEIEREISGKKVNFKADYTLKEVKDGMANIDFTGQLIQKADSKKLGDMNGTYSIVLESGMLKDGKIKMLIDMEVDNPAGSKQQVKIDQTITMTGRS